MSFRNKIIPINELTNWRNQLTDSLVVTNGCFDILHLGHISYLEEARNLSANLLVGVNCDVAVRSLKGSGRPINSEMDRASMLAALEFVSYVSIFQGVSAVDFLAMVRPDIYVKGGDYTIDTLNQQEYNIVKENGGRVVILPLVPNKSTTNLVQKISDTNKGVNLCPNTKEYWDWFDKI